MVEGSGAFGHFEVTHDVSAYTKAAVFQPSTKTDTLIRFSSVASEHGSPDKMLRVRLGVNDKQIPVNAPKVPVHSYSKDGAMRVQNVSDPVYASNSKGGPQAAPERYPYMEKWEASGEFMHAAYTPRKDNDDFVQAGTLVREVMDAAAHDRLVSNVVGHLKNGVSEPVLQRAFEYWRNIDKEIGDRIAKAVKDT